MGKSKKSTEKKGEEKIEETSEKEAEKLKSIKGTNKKHDRQLAWAFILMISIILIVIFGPYAWKSFVNQFVYENINFQKTKLGEIIFYSTKIPLANQQSKITGAYAINFRKDPRGLENIEVNLIDDPIRFKKDYTVYISLDPEMQACEDNSIALINFAGFLRDFGGLEIKSAVSDFNYSKETDIPYVTCSSRPENTVIYIRSGKETKIEQTNENCYELTYSNCEILGVTEKFVLEILGNYMSYFVVEN